MAKLSKEDFILIILTVVFVVADIVLALCLGFVLPRHVTHPDYYRANNVAYNFEKAVTKCSCLARVFPRGTRSYISFVKMMPQMVYRRSVVDLATKRKKYPPYLVSLSLPAYSDDVEQKIFACNGLIILDDWLLTGKNCVQEDSEWTQLSVRSGSYFWSKFGRKHSVVGIAKVSEMSDLIFLRVFPKFSDDILSFHLRGLVINNNSTYHVSFGWDDQIYKKELGFRYKHNMFVVEKWASKTSSFERDDF